MKQKVNQKKRSMKTFFKVWIKANGEIKEFRIESTKLRKFTATPSYGVYKPKREIQVSCYIIDIYLYLTHRVEMCGQIGSVKKQKRYTLHDYDYEVYIYCGDGMLANVYSELAEVVITIEEINVLDGGVTIHEHIK